MTLHFNKMHFLFSHRYVMLTVVEDGRIKRDFGSDENVKVYVINNSIRQLLYKKFFLYL